MQKDHGIGPGAISPYAYYNSEVKPLYSELESTKGTLNYFIKWSELFPKIESKRKRYIPFLPPILIGTAILKVASDYYESLGYDVDDVEGSEIDEIYNIDLIATSESTILVAQVKGGEISSQEVKKFLRDAPNYIIENHNEKKHKELNIVHFILNKYAQKSFIGLSKGLIEKGFVPHTLSIEQLCDALPKYRRLFKEMKKLRLR